MKFDRLIVQVMGIKSVAPNILEFSLESPTHDLPAFSPGSHIQVAMPTEHREICNAYSLCGDPQDKSFYKIAVNLSDDSRGGSAYMHSKVKQGDYLSITPPANFFAPVWSAQNHILIAGGVGITPFMSYVPELLRRSKNFELHYLYRSEHGGAYAEELERLLSSRYTAYDASVNSRCDVADILHARTAGTHVYICGPDGLLKAVQATARELGWPKNLLHYEAFAAPKPGAPFRVTLSKSGKALQVDGDESLLEALEREDISVPNLCRAGVCGQCFTPVLEGGVEHRDAFLSDIEKDRGNCIMPCVSRATGEDLILNL